MGALLSNTASVEHHNLVGMQGGAQPVCNDYDCLVLFQVP
jgi:hypothetical protein